MVDIYVKGYGFLSFAKNMSRNLGGFPSMLLGTLGASLIGNIFASKGMNRVGERFIRAGYGSSIKKGFLILPHPLTNSEI